MMNAPRLLLFALLLLATGGWECGPSYTKDPGFEVWCDDKLCYWEVEAGSVEPVPTWHEGDRGARLSGGAVLAQLLPIDSFDATCLAVTLVAAQETAGMLRLELDFLDDGSAEIERDVELTGSFSELRFELRTPSWYRDVRVRLRQIGPPVTIARLRIEGGGDCTDPAPPLSNRPLGATCEKAEQCQSGLCAKASMPLFGEGRCSTCDETLPCGGAQACGVDYVDGFEAYYDCGPAARFALGEFCRDDAGCASGSCCEGICSECCASSDCEGGASCEAPTLSALDPQSTDGVGAFLPKLCGPGEGQRPAGDTCYGNDDCASRSCSGKSWKRCLLSSGSCASDDDCVLVCLDLGLRDGVCE